MRRRIHGVDFSGAADAGQKIWIATGVNVGETLHIQECQRGDMLPGSGRKRWQCHEALVDMIAHDKMGVFGLDFPFSLPRILIPYGRWEEFILSFAKHYPCPEAFRSACLVAAHGAELRRVTDIESRTPFAAYNLRLYRQTYFGIRDVLAPIVAQGFGCVLPMQVPLPDKPWIVEVCPASTLKRADLYQPYKGRTERHLAARKDILTRLEAAGTVSILSKELRRAILCNSGGDALDSVIAALTTFHAISMLPLPLVPGSTYMLEGYIY
jgi:hypothetical protein